MKKTIQEKVLTQLSKKRKSFSRKEILECVAIAKGLPKNAYHKRGGYYGDAIAYWMRRDLLKTIGKNSYKVTKLGKLYLKDKTKYKFKRLQLELERVKKVNQSYGEWERSFVMSRFRINRDTYENDFKHLIGKTIYDISFLDEKSCKKLGWYKRPLEIIFDDGSKLTPMADDEGNNGGSMCYNGTKWGKNVSEVIYTI
tara:strand:- start:883 stop:1476 length:594 start_codon:yes stop_codon:yes gene_type:complete